MVFQEISTSNFSHDHVVRTEFGQPINILDEIFFKSTQYPQQYMKTTSMLQQASMLSNFFHGPDYNTGYSTAYNYQVCLSLYIFYYCHKKCS